jgi:DNA-binding MarR family transcriptional regulator
MSIKLAEIGLHIGQGDLLTSLAEGEIIAVSESAKRLNIRPSSASKLIDRLVEQGFIRRFADPLDSRKSLIEITPSGALARSKVSRIQVEVEREVFSKITMSEKASIDDRFDSIDRVLTSLMHRVRN